MWIGGFLCFAFCVQCSVTSLDSGGVVSRNSGVNVSKDIDYSRLGMEELLQLPKTMLLDSNGQYIPIYSHWGSQQCSAELFYNEGVLGKGGNAVVFRAQHRENGKKVAIKVFTVDDSDDNEGLLEAIRKEEILLASLEHPNFPELYCSFTKGQQVFLVMQYLDGIDLVARLDDESDPFPFDFTLTVMMKIVEALEYLHRRHIIHRDVKLENIIVTRDGHVYLFDLEHAVYAPDGATMSAGTPCNMAPEMWGLETYDNGVDLWALGVAFYEMITLQHPFQDYVSRDQLFEAISQGVPATGDPNVDYLLQKLCNLDPKQRWSSANKSMDLIKLHLHSMTSVYSEMTDFTMKSELTDW